MTIVNMYEAKTNLSKIAERVLAGEQIVLAKNGKPIIDLSIHTATERPPRKLGVWAHKALPIDYKALQAMDAEIADEMLNDPLSH